MSSANRIETLRESFKEAQSVRASLESTLNDLRNKRRELERTSDLELDKLKNVTALHAKSAEQLKVTQHKTNQSQVLLDSIEATNRDKKSLLQRMDREMSKENQNIVHDLHIFEDCLHELSLTLVNAKKRYLPAILREDIEKIKRENRSLQEQAMKLQKELGFLQKFATSLGYSSLQSRGGQGDGIDRLLVWEMLTGDLKSTLEKTEKLQSGQSIGR